ncbi:MAG: hypothetical protein IPG77_13580 [Betaproteobacteria bacterium]|nr:hypothetical protein [Betaproteobacteria bacterium]
MTGKDHGPADRVAGLVQCATSGRRSRPHRGDGNGPCKHLGRPAALDHRRGDAGRSRLRHAARLGAGRAAGARQRLAAATAAAQLWQKDAQLVRVETRNADAQGRSPGWSYVFDSPGAKKQTLVSVFGSDKPDLMPTGTAYRRPLGDFVDSTVAMQEAVRRGLKTVAYGMAMSITGGEPVQWLVLSGDQTFVVDGATGRFVRREKD